MMFPTLVWAQKSSTDILATVNGKKYYKHTVGKGETIYGIAQKYNLQPKDIVLENPSAIDGVKQGDVLLIPVTGTVKSADSSGLGVADEKQGNYIYHEVLPKETLYSLSKRYGTTVSIIDSLNPDIAIKGLQKGHKIRLPIVQTPVPPPIVKKQPESHPILKDTTKPAPPILQKTEVKQNVDEAKAYKSLVVEQTHADTAKPIVPIKDTGKKLSRYNIALIMPFANENADTLRLGRLMEGTELVPQTTQISVDFYHGIVLALDSLAKKGFKANLHVYNILPGSDTSSRRVDSLLKKTEMPSMNLIIGPPSASNFKRVAKFAELHHISIVSPLSPESSILKNNSMASKTTPSTITETEFEADYIASHYTSMNIILIHNRDANDEYYEIFKKRFKMTDSILGHKDTLRHAESMGGVSGLKNKMSDKLVNVIVMPYQGAPYIAKFVNELSNSHFEKEDSLILFGMHNWANNDALAPDNLDTLNCHFPTNEYLNYSDSNTKKFILKYRNSYLSEPSYYSCEGYDAGMFYGNLLRMYGTDMQNHLGDAKYRGVQTSFQMVQSSPASGYENKAVYILEYVNYHEKLDSK
ncbi:MAG TPA: LysM domain-containing protein [Bacteroidia bacterium]|nr:LysM domain-containing protein [Bacteroidia bacterium]